jgi:hypothetical protein
MLPTSISLLLKRNRPALALASRVSQRSVVLGAVLLLGSSLTVLATANDRPNITSLTVSPAEINEGEAVTINVTFTDADVTDHHTLAIGWNDGTPHQKVQLPLGQYSYQLTRTYPDNLKGVSTGFFVRVMDHQLPIGSNDNTEGHGSDRWGHALAVNNVAPVINSHTVRVNKTPGKSSAVVVEGTYTEPGTADPVDIIANWGDGAPGQPKSMSACTVNQHAKTFRCEHTYATSPARTYQITLKAQDDDGGEHSVTHAIQIP